MFSYFITKNVMYNFQRLTIVEFAVHNKHYLIWRLHDTEDYKLFTKLRQIAKVQYVEKPCLSLHSKTKWMKFSIVVFLKGRKKKQ